MEGYSVTEAASVLGVPTERVWELLARGVLSGVPDGETGMRVFLQPRPAPAPTPLDHARSDAPRGPGRDEPAGELSPFRELLTEFRNLTERYGQALLALGEARGEVAALRSRVDLLEARMDLRLPAAAPMPAPAPWPEPRAASTSASGVVGPGEAPEPSVEADDEDHEPRRRRRRPRATESFAEALARAEDPTAPELPGAAEAAVALAALRAAAAESASPPPSEVALPRELPAAESIDLAPEPATDAAPVVAPAPPPAPEPVAVPEPPAPVDSGAVPDPEPVTAEPPAAEPDAFEVVDTAPEPRAEVNESAPDALADANAADAPALAGILEPGPAGSGTADPAPDDSAGVPASAAHAPAPTASEPAAVPLHDDRPPIEWDPERYTVEISEPDWYEGEEEEAAGSTSAPSPDTDASHPRDLSAPAAVEQPVAVTDAPAWAEPEMSEAVADERAAEVQSADEDAVPAMPVNEAPPQQRGAATVEQPAPPATVEQPAPPAIVEHAAPHLAVEQSPPPVSVRQSAPPPVVAPVRRDEETMLWFGRAPAADVTDAAGADEMEVVGGPPAVADSAATPRSMPGGAELDEALSALEAIGRDAQPLPIPSAAAEPSWPREPTVTRPADSGPAESTVTAPPSPTTRAYRRLRRIFPG